MKPLQPGAGAAAAAAGLAGQLVQWSMDTLAGWRWRHSGVAVLVGTLTLFNMGTLLLNLGSFNLPRAWVYNVVQFGFVGVFMLRVADRAAGAGRSRPLAYGLAVLGTIVSGVWVVGPMLYPLIGGEPGWGLQQDVMLALNLVPSLVLGTWAYAHWRQGHDARGRLQARHLARARAQQELQASRLLALQARVEPQFLFETLAQVRDGIDADPEAADALLTDLIALLRAMQPAAGATASSVLRELALVEAYGRVAGAGALQPPRLALHADALAQTARLAPLLVLPALRSLVGDAPGGRWQLHATVQRERLLIVVQPRQPDWTTRVALRSLELAPLLERARAVHGDSALIAITDGGEPALRLDLPFDPSPTPGTTPARAGSPPGPEPAP